MALSDAVDVVVIDFVLSLSGSDIIHDIPRAFFFSGVSDSEYPGVTFINDAPYCHLWFSNEGLEW